MRHVRFLPILGAILAVIVAAIAFLPSPSSLASAWRFADDPPELTQAREAWKTGKYATAEETLEALLAKPDSAKDPKIAVKIAFALADCQRSQGKLDAASATLAKVLEKTPDLADAHGKLADLKFTRGDWAGAEAAIQAALKSNPDHLLARWTAVRLQIARGRISEAVESCKWFIDYQNGHPAEVDGNADALVLIGQAAEIYYRAIARGDELSETLNDVINQIYEKALKADPLCWQAAWLEGRLFLAGYNERLAIPELQRALKINPRAVEAIVTLGQADLNGYNLASGRKRAERALETNPAYTPALVLLADLNISDERFADALQAAEKAVAINGKDQQALARLAAARRLTLDREGALAVEALVTADNPKPASFFAAIGERLADRRKYPDAERAFLKAVAADPDHADARIGLGMLYMQVGREAEAKTLFDAAFAADPFNVRADNMMKVLKHLSTYKTIESPRFEVLVDEAQDALLGKYMSRYLESVSEELVKRFQYAPPAKTRIEVLKSHQWFSGRTTGLPFIPTVGACTGKVVALASPRTTQKPFNWARVLKHEVVHVITLQQTEFNIPHWYTEALAVDSEGYPRPQEWNKMLLERVPARRLLNLDTINLGFIRPKEPEERQLAYCQAQLYAQFMVQKFGPDSLAKMLDAYRRGLTTTQAVEDCFKVKKADFEKDYLAFLDADVRKIKARVSSEKPIAFSELEAQVKAKPDDPDLNARLAYEHFARRDLKEARPYADKALKLKPHHPLASFVKARLLITIGDDDAALELLRPALNAEDPNERVVDALAELEMKAGNLDEAERLYELARKNDPVVSKWIAGLARVHLRQKREDKFLEDLAMLAMNDADDLLLRKELANRHLKAKNAEQAEKWANECLFIQVYDPDCHVHLADALTMRGKFEGAAEEYRAALSLRPKRPNDLKVKLAQALDGQGQRDEARRTLDEVLKADPEHPEALELAKTIKAP